MGAPMCVQPNITIEDIIIGRTVPKIALPAIPQPAVRSSLPTISGPCGNGGSNYFEVSGGGILVVWGFQLLVILAMLGLGWWWLRKIGYAKNKIGRWQFVKFGLLGLVVWIVAAAVIPGLLYAVAWPLVKLFQIFHAS